MPSFVKIAVFRLTFASSMRYNDHVANPMLHWLTCQHP